MTASTSIHSNALNFMSCLKGGVDPRTGLYTVSITLPELQGNDLRGPGMTPGLAYNPLNTLDIGFGMGWTMQLSEYDPGTQILALSTGETFRVTDTGGTPWRMEEQKIDSFHFYQDDENHYRVMHRSGLVEILEVRGNDARSVALPVRILSASGHGITLDYLPFSTTHQRLSRITDDLGNTLLEVRREPEGYIVELLVHPYGADGEPLARFVMTLLGADKRVSTVTLPTEDQASWRFEYGSRNDQVYIERVQTPAGGREEIYYLDDGHRFPESARRLPLPRVTRHIVFPGFEQPKIDVRYTYEGVDENNQLVTNNFLGANLLVSWQNNGLDNLYLTLDEYDYFCTERLFVDDAEEPVRSIERKFNRFHLQTLEITRQGNHVQTQETTYNILPATRYKDQPSDCQLPREITTRWQIENKPLSRFETVRHTYDSYGNPRTQTRADGIVEESIWYPADSEVGEGCPPDPEEFVRHLKEKTIHPAREAQSGAPTLRTRYRYTSFPPIDGSTLDDMILPESETLVQVVGEDDELELQRTVVNVFNVPDDPLLHGRNQSQTVTINGKSTLTTYTFARLDSPQLGLPVLETTQTLTTDFDSVSKTIVQQHSLTTAQELLNVVNGVETRRVYDALNRLTHETVASGTEFEASREYEYTLCANDGEQAGQIVFNARRAMTRTLFDGLGRRIYEERDKIDSDNPDRARRTYAAQYDAQGALKTETSYDWLEGRELALPLTYDYDDWGQQSCVTDAAGVQTHQDYDPVGTLESKGCPIQRNWVQSAGPTPTVSGRSETWLNVFGKADRTMSLDATGQVLGTQTFLYDGLGRCTQQTDELQHTTGFSYDAWSRMVSTTLPDTSTVSREYAPHSTADLPTALSMVHPDGSTRTLAGEQVFDGLERMTQVKVGQRIERYAYDGDRLQVKSRTTAAGDTIDFDYNLVLTEQPVSSTAPDEHAEFNYDPTSARLTRAANELGVRSYDYDPLNRLRSEQWLDSQGKTWKTTYVSSLQGRQLRRTELQQGSDAGLETVYHYDDLGRVGTADQGNLHAAFQYDALGQISLITVQDKDAGTTLSTELTYDDQGREVRRVLKLAPHTPLTLEQQWRVDGLLATRHLQQDKISLLKESFKYDSRGRLTSHTCAGRQLPRDAEGRAIKQQIFSFDALDNIILSVSTFADGSTERARFSHNNSDEPCQLTGIAYFPARTTPDPTFSYDLNGNQLNDERGQQLRYDSQNRLLDVEQAGQPVSQYRYDSHDHLVTSRHGSASETLRFYQDQQLSSSVQDDRQSQYLYLGEQPLGQQQAHDPAQTLLLLTDANLSVLGESQQNDLRMSVYNAYGERHSDDTLLSDFGYNGEIRDPSSGWYLLGQGYRAYNPTLMRFHSPDSLSPFGAGGLNPYTYCLGNPIALRDPTGHDASGQSGRLRRPDEGILPSSTGGGGGWVAWVFVAVGVVFTVGLAATTIATFGATAPVSVPLMGFTISGTTAKAITVASFATATALSTASTAASAYATAKDDETAFNIALYTGLAMLPFAAVGGWVNSALKAAAALEAAALAEQGQGAMTYAGRSVSMAKNSGEGVLSAGGASDVVDDVGAGIIRTGNKGPAVPPKPSGVKAVPFADGASSNAAVKTSRPDNFRGPRWFGKVPRASATVVAKPPKQPSRWDAILKAKKYIASRFRSVNGPAPDQYPNGPIRR